MAKQQAAAKQRQEEEADDQANKISNEIEGLQRKKQRIQDKFEGLNRHVDECTAEMRDYEQRMDQLKTDIRRQRDILKVRQGEVRRLKSEAVSLRRQADTACYQGTTNIQYGFDSRKLLEEAESKMQQAQKDERNVEDFQKLVSDGERNLVKMGDQLLVNGRHRLEVERERKQQEDKVREITQQLQVNRNKVDQQKSAVRRLREEEGRLDREYYEKMDEADKFEREARQLEAEAARLEWESR